MPGADAFLGKITPELLARADRLRWVQAFTASLEHYMFPELVAHPCTLTNMRGLFGDVIADQVMGYVLCFARNLHTYIRQPGRAPLRAGRRRVGAGEQRRPGPGTVNAMDRATIFLPDATLGIVGLGAIGAEIARRALAFGMTVRAVDRFPDRTRPARGGRARSRGSTACPTCWPGATSSSSPPRTRPRRPACSTPRRSRTCGRPSYLINIGRGAIVVLDDLVAALRAGRLAGAALDVFEVEPLPADHPLWDFPNVIITPHTAGYSPVIAGRHLATLVENVGRFARGEPLMNVVDKAAWY